jgi:hypothetical protein
VPIFDGFLEIVDPAQTSDREFAVGLSLEVVEVVSNPQNALFEPAKVFVGRGGPRVLVCDRSYWEEKCARGGKDEEPESTDT